MMHFDMRPIEKEYPKAFALLKKWVTLPGDQISITDRGDIMNLRGGIYEGFNPLELDMFFDEQGIHGWVQYDLAFGWRYGRTAFSHESISQTIFNWKRKPEDRLARRSEALTALWLKEFSILEGMQK